MKVKCCFPVYLDSPKTEMLIYPQTTHISRVSFHWNCFAVCHTAWWSTEVWPRKEKENMEQETRENGLSQEPRHLRLQHQLRGSFKMVYLTTVSIIQGVVL